jgi:hypothetical protein
LLDLILGSRGAAKTFKVLVNIQFGKIKCNFIYFKKLSKKNIYFSKKAFTSASSN